MPTLIYTKTDPQAKFPGKAYVDDAGFDLATLGAQTVQPGQFCDLHTGIAVKLPEGYWGLLTGRSSALRTWGLIVNQGIIDNGFRGELMIGVQNVSPEPVRVPTGTRLGQLIPVPMGMVNRRWYTLEAAELGETARGANGFGSTGK